MGPVSINSVTCLHCVRSLLKRRIEQFISVSKSLFSYWKLLYLGEFTKGYVFHGDPERVFKEFFGGDNPFAGKLFRLWSAIHAIGKHWISLFTETK